MSASPLATVGVLAMKGSYAVDALLAWRRIPCAHVALDASWLNPYQLPRVDRGRTVLVASNWLQWLADQGLDPVQHGLLPLRRRFSRLIGLDQADPVQLDFPEAVMQALDVVLKVNGVFRDRDLYNWIVGAPTPDGNWTQKRHSRGQPYTNASLDKVTLSVPCFLGTSAWFRRRTRRFYDHGHWRRLLAGAGDLLVEALPLLPARRRAVVHFAGALTHGQRLTAARMLCLGGIRWHGGLTSVPTAVAGLHGVGLTQLSPVARAALEDAVRRESLAFAPRNRLRYLMGMRNCRAVLSVTGYGEVCFRMAEAWAMNRVLVCQDLSHVETLLPLQAGENVVFCRPDLADLVEVLRSVDAKPDEAQRIAEQGARIWRRWISDPHRVLSKAFAPLLN
jgi:hypothetical protein